MGEIPSILTDFFPEWSRTQVYWFADPYYHYSTQRNDMLKFIANDLFDIGLAVIAVKAAKQFSVYLFLVLVIVLGYLIVGFIMLFWDFKTSHLFFYDFLLTIFILIKGVFKGYRPETLARIKSIF